MAPQPQPARRRLAAKIRARTRSSFHCAGCNRSDFRNRMLFNTHKCMEQAGRWASAKARKIARQNGKAVEEARRLARRVREYKGLTDSRGTRTNKGRSRPEAPARGHLRLRDVRAMHRHDRDHDKADRHERKATRHRARDHHGPADTRQARAANLRGRWPVRQPRAPRPSPARPEARVRSNGTRPSPARTSR